MVISELERDLRISLFLTPNLGRIGWHRILNVFGSAEDVYRATEKDLLQCKRLSLKAIAYILKGPNQAKVDEQKNLCEMRDVNCTLIEEVEYPTLLNKFEFPPPILFWHSHKKMSYFVSNPSVAIVGTRNPSIEGLKVANYFSRELSKKGVTIVSGMALGVDRAAHREVLRTSCKTIGVLGEGLDRFNPRESSVHESMWENALLLSEFPMGTLPTRYTFPIRNRTISGLSQSTLVIEAGLKSGALITAKITKDQGRPVFVTPGDVLKGSNLGGHQLLRSGSCLALSPNDVLEAVGVDAFTDVNKAEYEIQNATIDCVSNMSKQQNKVYNYLQEALQPHEISQACKETLSNIYSILIELEMMGLIMRYPGNKYIRK